MSFQVYTHQLHAGSATPAEVMALQQSLCAAHGRVVAVASSGHNVDLYDSHDTAELASVLGSGSCKMRYLSTFAVRDLHDNVAVTGLAFLRGGLLAVAGTTSRGSGEWAGLGASALAHRQ
jgi:hypothetical protein